MSLDLYQDETRERLASLRPVSTPEAGVFDNFLAGSAKMTMRGFAGAASGIDIAGGALASVQDKIMGTGTQAQDQYFKEHDDVFGSAVDYWTPKPNEVGVASEVVGGLLSTLPLVIMSPAAAIAGTQLGTAEELVKKGVSAEKAQGVGAVQAAGLGVGIWMPILGQNGWQRVLIGGAGYNAAQGVVMRGASGQILEGTPAADEFKAFDGKALTLDVLMGMAFGSLAHLSPSQRQQGAQYWERLTKWAENLDPSQVDSIAALRQSQHMNVDSVPGKLEGVSDIEAHTQRVKAAIDQLSKGEPVAVDDLRAPAFEEDARRAAASEKNMAGLEKNAESIRSEEGIAPLPEETGAPAGQPRGAEPPPPRGPSEGKPAGAEATKIVDEEGNPLVVYHGGPAGIAEFKGKFRVPPEFVGDQVSYDQKGRDGKNAPIYFTPNKESAQNIAERMRGRHGLGEYEIQIYERELNVKNPKIVKSDDVRREDISVAYLSEKEISKWQKEGYDGLVVSDDRSIKNAQEIVVFSPSQIHEPGKLKEKAGATAKPIDPHFAEAMRIADEHPDLQVRTGVDANGEPTSVTAKTFVEEAAGAATKIREQAKLLAIAAQCMLGVQ